MPLIIILALCAGLGPLVTYGLTSVKSSWDIAAAVRDARADERKIMQAEQSRLAVEMMRAADAAELTVTPTPDAPDQIRKLCDKSASCRDRAKKEASK